MIIKKNQGNLKNQKRVSPNLKKNNKEKDSKS